MSDPNLKQQPPLRLRAEASESGLSPTASVNQQSCGLINVVSSTNIAVHMEAMMSLWKEHTKILLQLLATEQRIAAEMIQLASEYHGPDIQSGHTYMSWFAWVRKELNQLQESRKAQTETKSEV
jgi:hypothetical protein